MARTAPIKAKPSKPSTVKAAPKRKSVPAPESIDSSDDSSPPPLYLDKTFVLRLVLAKMEVSKSCDWFELAQRMGEKTGDSVQVKGRKKKESSKMWSGGELHDIFHDTILPALKAGRALWSDDAIASDIVLPPRAIPVEVTAEEAEEIAEKEEEVRQEELESEEEEGTPDEMTVVAEVEKEDVEDQMAVAEVTQEVEEEEMGEEQVEEEETPIQVVQEEEEGKELQEIEVTAEIEEEEVPEVEKVEIVQQKKERAKRPPKVETREIIKTKTVTKPATTYRKPKTSPPVPPTLGYRHSVVNKTGDNDKKRMRQAYGDEDDDSTIRSSPSSKSKTTTSATNSKKSKTSVTPPSSGRVGRTTKKVFKYVDLSESEEE